MLVERNHRKKAPFCSDHAPLLARASSLTFSCQRPQHFDVRCNGEVVNWSPEFYDVLQNTVGGGKPKMRWYFSQREGASWPTSSILGGRAPASEEEQVKLIDVLQDWKSEKYQSMLGSGEVPPRPGEGERERR